jgi:hypothetical protein
MRKKCILLGTVAIAAGMAASADAGSLGTYGDVTITGDGYELTSVDGGTGFPNPHPTAYAGVYTNTSSLTPDTLTELSVDYEMQEASFENGAPRFSIGDSSGNEAYIYFGNTTNGFNFTDPNAGSSSLNSTGNYADLLSGELRVESNGFGGLNTSNTPMTWSQFLTADGGIAGSAAIAFITVDLDGGDGALGTQEMLLNNLDINGTIYSAPAVPLPAPIYAVPVLMAGLGVLQLRKRRTTAA